MLTEPNVGGRQKTRSIARRASNAAVLQSSLFCVERMCLVKNITKKEAIKIVTECAKEYNKQLENKSLLFICSDKHKRITYYEFKFLSRHFLHLTGLTFNFKTIEAKNNASLSVVFYEKCLNGQLSESDFEFSEDGTSIIKLEILPHLICKNLKANIIGDYNCLTPKLVTSKLAGNIQGCLGFVQDENKEYVPNTALRVDIRDYIKNNVRVIAVLRKDINSLPYSEITYKA